MNFFGVSHRTLAMMVLSIFMAACASTPTWIDVRTADEFSQKHVPEAANIPYDEIGTKISALGLKKNQVIYLYCGSGRRAGLAKETLEGLGYTQVVNIGGLDDALAKTENKDNK